MMVPGYCVVEILTHCGLVMPYGIGSGDGLLPDGTIIWTNVDLPAVQSSDIWVICLLGNH